MLSFIHVTVSNCVCRVWILARWILSVFRILQNKQIKRFCPTSPFTQRDRWSNKVERSQSYMPVLSRTRKNVSCWENKDTKQHWQDWIKRESVFFRLAQQNEEHFNLFHCLKVCPQSAYILNNYTMLRLNDGLIHDYNMYCTVYVL